MECNFPRCPCTFIAAGFWKIDRALAVEILFRYRRRLPSIAKSSSLFRKSDDEMSGDQAISMTSSSGVANRWQCQYLLSCRLSQISFASNSTVSSTSSFEFECLVFESEALGGLLRYAVVLEATFPMSLSKRETVVFFPHGSSIFSDDTSRTCASRLLCMSLNMS